MNKPSKDNLAAARAKLSGILVECPRGGDHKYCQLAEQRYLPSSEKFEWLMSLPVDELQNIYSSHCRCLKTKVY